MMPHDPLADLEDNAVLETARDVHARMISADRDSDGYQGLLTAWREVCQELNRRGMSDTVTEGSTSHARPWEVC